MADAMVKDLVIILTTCGSLTPPHLKRRTQTFFLYSAFIETQNAVRAIVVCELAHVNIPLLIHTGDYQGS